MEIVEPTPKNTSQPTALDPVTTVMTKVPTTKGDVGAFLSSFGVGYLIIDFFAAGIGLPPPITTAALISAVVVGTKNSIQAYLSRAPDPGSKETLNKRSEAFEKRLERDDTVIAQETRSRLLRAKEYWEDGIDSNTVFEKTLDQLIMEYKAATDIPALSGRSV